MLSTLSVITGCLGHQLIKSHTSVTVRNGLRRGCEISFFMSDFSTYEMLLPSVNQHLTSSGVQMDHPATSAA